MINGAEVALARELSLPELREVLETHLEGLRALAGMVNDMLFLARADRGALAENAGPLSVRAEALHVVDFVESVTEERGQTVTIEGDARLAANSLLVCRAIVNLLTNGARHASTGAALTVRIRPHVRPFLARRQCAHEVR